MAAKTWEGSAHPCWCIIHMNEGKILVGSKDLLDRRVGITTLYEERRKKKITLQMLLQVLRNRKEVQH
jgi:hypothetical protein